MPYQTINIGTTANDGTGDSARTWAQKTNSNNAYFQALIDALAGSITVNGNQAHLLKYPGNSNQSVVELNDRIVMFANTTTILTAQYTNALADGDTDNIGTAPDWDDGNYLPLAIQSTT